ncbi:hypothetical protein [Alkaliphilus sp. B6464]|uniref:hypothetical protein n=1 Tax=Alkaliphilus sp. B6464 TaxID=2731219 RepID=UPI001BA65B60|nr:hypothetical protein [Alkaliphilus sp. B6464]QUH22201.1 hypothetical protein HYG84_20045 [Alkaliphilus sp. B6464]
MVEEIVMEKDERYRLLEGYLSEFVEKLNKIGFEVYGSTTHLSMILEVKDK